MWSRISFPFKTKTHYFCNAKGQILSVSSNGNRKILKRNNLGHYFIDVCLPNTKPIKRKSYSVASLVLKTLVGPAPKNHIACHLNHNVKDNRVNNLRWMKRKDIIAYHFKYGSIGNRKLTTSQVEQIKILKNRLI